MSSLGVDIVAGTEYRSGGWSGTLDVRYSYQSATDRTPDSYSFGQQIPYIARNTVTADLKACWKGFTLNPRWIFKAGRTDAAGSLANWNTLDLTLSKELFTNKAYSISINLSAKNLLNCEYELVSGYPMPGRSLLGGIGLIF